MNYWKIYPTLIVNLKKCSSIELNKTMIHFNFPEFVELGLRNDPNKNEKFCTIHFKNEENAKNDFQQIINQLKNI